jgi:hypothetical protein
MHSRTQPGSNFEFGVHWLNGFDSTVNPVDVANDERFVGVSPLTGARVSAEIPPF